ncbi:ABC transporter G family [Raphidocelis subcapitata]|uniref:ABC transporter G family n=1 Tax=Raphidocelis subcapitata TaxID=307507 RepID=A0A2V0NK51_9CHLO|nr:ABC transporter G family [Raphidocelis subcapitata]|eukprot:GBF87651.1 ABC transporter G family [Raphidocelis subcapitata]
MGAWVELYVPVLVAAHAFAAFFLVRVLLIVYKPAGRGNGQSASGGKAKLADGGKSDAKMGGGAAAAPGAPSALAVGAAPASGPPPPSSVGDDGPPAGLLGPDPQAVPPKDSCLILRRLTTNLNLRPLLLEWADLGCAYDTSGGTKVVLERVYGQAEPGEMLALMGPSGAGKSTLMDIISARKSVGRLTGTVFVNGVPRGPDFGRRTAYVPQNDNFLPTMTVHETASYYAALLLPRSWVPAQRRERVGLVLAAMGLSHTENTLVGGMLPGGIMLRGLSGGERKRLSIATGIISTPAIVFLDEPTSGLDAFAALSVMRYMQAMAHRGGHTVIASIHQPRAAIWAMFDTALVLSAGLLVYFGPREGMVPWFASLGYPYDAEMHGVPSDWVMDLVNVGFHKPQKYYGRMISTKEELRAASAAFVASYLAERGAGAAEDGRADGGDKSGGRAGRQPPLAALPAPSHPLPLQADGGAPHPQHPQHPRRKSARFLSSAAPQQPPADSERDGDIEAPRHAAAAAAPPTPPPLPLPPLTVPSPPANGGTAAAGPGGQPPRTPLPADKVAAFQAVVDRHARITEGGGGGKGAARGGKGRGGGVWRAAAAAATCGLYGRGAGGGGGDWGSDADGDGDEWEAPAAASPRRRHTLGHRASHRRPGWLTQFRVLMWRELLAVTRNPADVAGRMLIFAWIAVLTGLIYYNLGDTLEDLRSRLNVLFLQPTIFLLLPYVYMSLYTADKQYYVADAAAKLYAPSAYYAAKTVAVLPFAVLNVVAFSWILYGMAGLRREAVPVVANGAISALLYLIAAQVLAFAAAVTPNQDLAFMVAIAWTAVNLLMSNFMVRYADMTQVWLSQLRYISAMGFAFEGYSIAEFVGGSYSCAGGLASDILGYLPTFLPNTPAVSSPLVRGVLTNPGPDCVIDLGSILTYFGIAKPLWLVFVILIGYLAVLHVATYFAYLGLARKERR